MLLLGVRRLSAAVGMAVALFGATAPAATMVSSGGLEVQVDVDEFSPVTVYRIDEGYDSFVVMAHKSGERKLALQTMTNYVGDWRLFQSAYLRGGAPLAVMKLDAKVLNCGEPGGCRKRERMAALFTPTQLAGALTEPTVAVQFAAESGHTLPVRFPADKVRAVLDVAGVKLPSSGR